MVNVNKLKGKIVEKGLTVEEVANQIGIDRSSLYRKMNEPDKITIKDANQLVEVLEITGQEAVAIFFNQIVA